MRIVLLIHSFEEYDAKYSFGISFCVEKLKYLNIVRRFIEFLIIDVNNDLLYI